MISGRKSAPAVKRLLPPPRAGIESKRPAGRKERFDAEQLEAEARDVGRDKDPMYANSRGQLIDVHELLKRDAFESPNDACDDHFEKNRPCPEAVFGVSDQYIILDTFEAVPAETKPERGRYQWNFMVQGTTGFQVIGVKDKIDTVIEIQIGPFVVPKFQTVPYTLNPFPGVGPLPPVGAMGANTALPILIPNVGPVILDPLLSPLTQVPFGGRVTIQLEEIGLQSFSDRRGARHHFELTTRPDIVHTADGPVDRGDIRLEPLHNWEVFVFTDPIKDVQGLTLIFRNPDIPIKFPPSCFYNVRAVASVPVGSGPFLQFNVRNHGLSPNDRIYISNFASGNPIIDTYVNRQEGLLVGVNGLTADTFRLNPDVYIGLLGDLTDGEPINPPSKYFNLDWDVANTAAAAYGFSARDFSGGYIYESDVPNPPGTQTIVTGVNDTVAWFDTVARVATLAAGVYTPQQLAVILEKAMNMVSSHYEVRVREVKQTLPSATLPPFQLVTTLFEIFTISRRDFPPHPGTRICVAKNRIRIPMRLRRIVDRLTQYIAP